MKTKIPPEIPTEYERGWVDFLNCKIDLSKRVFIPRIETEFWVKKSLRKLSKFAEGHPPRVLDIFSGSGCIGIAVLKNVKNSFVDFIDIEKKAVSQIKINLKLNKIAEGRYGIYASDMFDKLEGKRYDFIFANPPYVDPERIGDVQPSVLNYEPKTALFGGRGGLAIIKKFLNKAKAFLNEGGVIFMEFDPSQAKDVGDAALKEGYGSFKAFKDQFGKLRWAEISFR